MEVSLKKNSWLTSLYMWTYCLTSKTTNGWFSEEYWKNSWYLSTESYKFGLPNNLCKYFWQLVIAFISIPLTIWSYPCQWMNIKLSGYWHRLLASFLILLLVFIIALIGYKFFSDPYGVGIKALIIVGALIGIIAFVAACFGISELITKINNSEVIKTYQAKAAAKKAGICPRIIWTEEDKK